LESSFARLAHFVGHAAAEIKDHADRDGDVFGGEGNHFLLDVVFEDAEVVGLQAGDQPVVGSVTVTLTSARSTSKWIVPPGLKGVPGLSFRTSSFLTSFTSSRLASSLGLFSSGGLTCSRKHSEQQQQAND